MKGRSVRLLSRARYAKGWEEAGKKGGNAIQKFMSGHAVMHDFSDKDGPVYLKSNDEESGMRFQFRISDESVDRMHDVIKLSGWDLKQHKRNPVVPFGHNTNQLPVAQAIKTWREEGYLKSIAKFTPRDLYPFGHTVAQMIKGGFLRATSVGFRPLKMKAADDQETRPYGLDFINHELLEYSIVPVPANANALIDAGTKGIDLDLMKEFVGTVLDTQDFDPERDGLVVAAYQKAWDRYSSHPIIVELRSGGGVQWPRQARDLDLEEKDDSGDTAACPEGTKCPKGETDQTCPKGDECPKYNGQANYDSSLEVLRQFVDDVVGGAFDEDSLDEVKEALDEIESRSIGKLHVEVETNLDFAFAVTEEGQVIIRYNGIEIDRTYEEDVRFSVTVGPDGIVGLGVTTPGQEDYDPGMDYKSEEIEEDSLAYDKDEEEYDEELDDVEATSKTSSRRRELRELARAFVSELKERRRQVKARKGRRLQRGHR